MDRLPIRVRPYVGESQAGYLLRLAMRNGFLEPCDIVKRKLFNTAKRSALKEADINAISSMIQRPISFSEIEDKPFPKVCSSSRVIHARACLTCLKQNSIHKDEWQDPRNTHCKKHNLMLVDVCPHCKQELDFNVNLIQGYCSNEYCGRQIPSLPADSKIKNLTQDNVEDCIIAGLYALGEVTELKKKANFKYLDTSAILIAGVELLTNDDALNNWLGKISGKGLLASFPKNLAYPELFSLARHINKDWKLMQRAQIYKRSLPKAHTATSKALEIRTLAICLGLVADDLKPLWYRDMIRFSNTSHYQVDGLVDSNQFINALITKSSDKSNDEVSFMEATKFVEQFLMERSDLLLAMFNEKLPFYYQGNNSLLDSVYFTRAKLVEVGENHLELSKAKTVSIDTCAKISKISPDIIKQAIKTGLIKASGWKADKSTLKLVELKKLQDLHKNRQLNLEL